MKYTVFWMALVFPLASLLGFTPLQSGRAEEIADSGSPPLYAGLPGGKPEPSEGVEPTGSITLERALHAAITRHPSIVATSFGPFG